MAIFYKLESYDPLSYPDIDNVCAKNILKDTWKVIYLKDDPTKKYRLNLLGLNTGIGEIEMPAYIIAPNQTFPQPIPYLVFELENCTNPLDIIERKLDGVAIVSGYVAELSGFANCYTINNQVADTGQATATVLRRMQNCAECGTATFYRIQECDTLVTHDVEINGAVSIGDVLELEELAGCWQVLAVVGAKTQDVTIIARYDDCNKCKNQKAFYRVADCATGKTRLVEIVGGAYSVGDAITVQENEQCWEIIEPVKYAIVTWTHQSTTANCGSCEVPPNCKEDGERTIAYAGIVELPTPEPPDKGFKECCYKNIVFGDLGDSDPYKNDFTGVFFKRQTGADTCDFILHNVISAAQYALNDSTYGDFKNFGDIAEGPDLTTYIVRWEKVLSVLGAGLYQIEKSVTIAGLTFSIFSNTFTLEPFSDASADKTVRIDTKMDGELVHYGINFKGSEFETSVRTKGFFGRRNPTFEQDNLVKRNYDTVQISMSQTNEYEFQAGLIPECITTEIYDFVLFGNELFISDYNLNNHSYKYRVLPVELESNRGPSYYVTNRDSRLNLTFTDRFKNKRKLNC